ncbi:helix-turn-helix domain-containing GNAT family N-acetyltransferase [Phyllobacterium sp. 0TCS1.6C]|uniref:bifunctional helix-turn-helix transcriptional regulator/GNAT family N-acetyltransferase n=1 Tax=unclassified Phyllobacterium TaxID=2638441 RepID=UPI002264EDDC|nr:MULTISPECIES: helix-turn-helix domain-containing GNAT family N-acetyltransferase [unclassified Phyllobacterium]MCX8278693.1 helix-turn-helix domain-containing GNAT family N-acetyltransferase [Phyllobacterium sp. 0TCS1.6C]MCX8293477.1 helix-turn-helix domain-containing GNAT family N-acetyltransferase [Phyllobacterium sp. 0TCS1.6A]
MDAVAEFRSFNRFYTNEIGLLDKHLLASNFSLAEARVLYELAQGGKQTAAAIGRTLKMDKAHLSRIVARFEARGIVNVSTSPEHGRQRLISLSAAGRAAFSALDEGSQEQIAAMLLPLDDVAQNQLVASMRQIRKLIGRDDADAERVSFRSLRPGDCGWIIHRQTVLYHTEYGWDWTYEGLVADILSRFIANYDPVREDGWVAEYDGDVVGSVFLMQTAVPSVAKLRLLYVEPSARGLGIGRKLVGRCIERARQLDYDRLQLWTNDVLVSARRIYQAAGFELVGEEKHHSFGKDLVGQTWELALKP